MDYNNFVFFGEVMLEFAPLDDGIFKQNFAGDSYNSCWYFNQLSRMDTGFNAQYLTHLGVDTYSDILIDRMKALNIDASFIKRNASKDIGLDIIRNQENGERKFDYWRDNSAAKNMFEVDEALNADLSR